MVWYQRNKCGSLPATSRRRAHVRRLRSCNCTLPIFSFTPTALEVDTGVCTAPSTACTRSFVLLALAVLVVFRSSVLRILPVLGEFRPSVLALLRILEVPKYFKCSKYTRSILGASVNYWIVDIRRQHFLPPFDREKLNFCFFAFIFFDAILLVQ